VSDERHRVLLVDDEQLFLKATNRSLSRTFDVVATTSPLEALELLQQKSFDCLVSDLRMPEMAGLELLNRAAELDPRLGLVAMSAFSDAEALIEAINSGAVMAFLIKPFTVQDVTGAIFRSISRACTSGPSGTVLALFGDDVSAAQLQRWLDDAGLRSQLCATAGEVRRRLGRGGWDLLLIDLDLPESIDLLGVVREEHPHCWPVLLAGDRSRALSADLPQLGARDVLAKPLHGPEVLLRLQRALAQKRASEPAPDGRGDLADRLVGDSTVITAVRQMVRTVADVDCAVLIRGETGTGKELVSNGLHELSQRADAPLMAVNCASLTETLFESEVFGHERGAFTGAVQQKRGLCELAQHGSLLLDEIGEISLNVQAKLLRFLESGEYYRVGGVEVLHSDARVLAATNRDLGQMIEEGAFRADLYHRISTIEIFVPPLREHMEDLPQLVSFFLQRLARRHERTSISIAPDALEELTGYSWPGNVRELQSVLERGLLLSPDGRLRKGLLAGKAGERGGHGQQINTAVPLREALAEVTRAAEHEYLVQQLIACKGNVAEVSRRSGVDRRNLYRKLEALELDPQRFRGRG